MLINRPSYSDYLKSIFGVRVQKITINSGLSCPNRDGTKSIGGCTYCNNSSFSPKYTKNETDIIRQIELGISFFERKNKSNKYIAYFQSYTNTYGGIDQLIKNYTTALSYPGIVGLIIGTRPDCISDELLDFLSKLAKKHYVSIEYGVESTKNSTLMDINRCHTFEDSIMAFEKSANRGIDLGAHLILGLPGENNSDFLKHADELNKLPIKILKLHHLQIVKNTKMAVQFKEKPDSFRLFTLEEYIDLIQDFNKRLRPDIVIGRYIGESSTDKLIAPLWGGIKNYQFVKLL